MPEDDGEDKEARARVEQALLCPSCFVRARVRHCHFCKWLHCRDCNITWDPVSGRWMSDFWGTGGPVV